jgi:membrane associated rhomboid family serine protease
MTARENPFEGETFFRPNRSRSFLWGLALMALAAFLGASAWHGLAPWIAGGALSGQAILSLAGAAVFLVLGALMAANALFGLPRLIAGADGIEMETLFGARWANWNSLAVFAATPVYRGPLRRRIVVATAQITGPAISGNLRRGKRFAIPDAFTTPVAAIIAELNARRGRALGLAPGFGAKIAPLEPERQFGAPGANIPWLSFLILAALAAVFAAEQIYAIGPGGPLLRPSFTTLQALGGVSRNLVLSQGEWYRLFTAPLLHGDLTHIFFNGIALVMAGFLLERLVGRVWFFAFFLIGALGGSVMSIALNRADMLSVGASGAIMGLLAAAYVLSFRLPPGTKARWWIQLGAARLLIPALLPLAASGGAHVDYGAHLGGMLSGGAVALLLLRAWPETARLPASRDLAFGLGVAGVIVIAVSLTATAEAYPGYRKLAGLIPQEQMPKDQEEGQRRAADLVARYPEDPRAHWYRGTALATAGDYRGSERELRTGLYEAETLRFYFGDKLPNAMRTFLTVVLIEEGRQLDAKETARPLCAAPADAATPGRLQKFLADQHLCEG